MTSEGGRAPDKTGSPAEGAPPAWAWLDVRWLWQRVAGPPWWLPPAGAFPAADALAAPETRGLVFILGRQRRNNARCGDRIPAMGQRCSKAGDCQWGGNGSMLGKKHVHCCSMLNNGKYWELYCLKVREHPRPGIKVGGGSGPLAGFPTNVQENP